ncbi:uncharacterized protein LDX57_013056 [Aspergillus melleus]|uniref:uncharacterized protein n=1 Tax=Aspergillus melleus TaxID=138277 RepID=UPI001E8CE50D|nr:uncharacterized protein LDX57_013056 [Aspergillus melleus]KAH8424247.1 hypothetical protein LDX57_013056 [Aspergillus melleus]
MATAQSPLLGSHSCQPSLEDGQPRSHQERRTCLQSLTSKLLAVYWAFLVMGANDAAYGPLLPYFESYYDISYTAVSVLFLSPVCGYMFAAILNNEIHVRLGRRGIACIQSLCHLFTFAVVSFHPPYPILVATLAIGGVGNGVADSGWNAWIGAMSSSNELLGILHGLYGVGAMVSPLIATLLLSKANLPWFRFYHILAACAAIEVVTCVIAFWDSGPDDHQTIENAEESQRGGLRRALFQRPYAWVTWTCASYILVYMGVEVTIGGWTVTYMLRVRHADLFASDMAATGFWLGLTCGRFILGFVTSRLGQALAITVRYIQPLLLFQMFFFLLIHIIGRERVIAALNSLLEALLTGNKPNRDDRSTLWL